MLKNLMQNRFLSEKNMFFLLFFSSLVFCLVAFWPNLTNLTNAWQSDEYSHGYLIPPLAILLGWHKLTEKPPVLMASPWGLVTLCGAFFLLGMGHLSAFEPLTHYGFLAALIGLCLSFFGTAFTLRLLPAFAYLFFAIPLPRLLYVSLSQHLQLLSSTLGVLPLHVMGISVFQDGNIIDLGVLKLQVVEACSGLRYLFPLMSFGFLMAILYEDRMWKRIILFLSTVPLTIIMNAFRITLIGLSVDLWGVEMSRGLLHDFEGWVIFLFCVLLLFAEMWILNRIPPKGRFKNDYFSFAQGPIIKGVWPLSRIAFFGFLLCVGTGLSFYANLLTKRSETIPPAPLLANFPLEIGAWSGLVKPLESEILADLKLSDYILADYKRDTQEPPINFFIAYYDHQKVGSSAHSPSNCVPGGGWQIKSTSQQTITIQKGQILTLSRLVIQKGNARQIMYFWFDERGRVLPEQYGAKWFLFWDSLTMGRTDGSLVRLVTPLKDQETLEDAENRLNAFLRETYPLIRLTLPGMPLAPKHDFN